MKILNKKVSLPILAVLVMIGVIAGACTALALPITPIISNVVQQQFIYQSWTGTVTLSFPSTTSNIGQSVTLTASLNPLPTQYQSEQNVTFYFSDLSTITASTTITGDPTTGLALVGGNAKPLLSTVLTSGGLATLTFTPATTGTYYFIAEIATPT